jgi:hypothetical protein
MLYFLHIPKTSGSFIEAIIKSHKKEWPSSFVFGHHLPNPNQKNKLIEFFNSDKLKSCQFIKGHFATTPYQFVNNIQAFSLIREPLDRAMSFFKYVTRAVDITYPQSVYSYLKQNPNLQSANFISDLKWIEVFETEEDIHRFKNLDSYPYYLDTPKISFEELLLQIKQKNITISTMENKLFLLEELELAISNLLGEDIIFNPELQTDTGYRVQYNPYTMDLSCLTQDIKEEFKMLNNLDYQLYNYVKDHETKTGRSLTPGDIVF